MNGLGTAKAVAFFRISDVRYRNSAFFHTVDQDLRLIGGDDFILKPLKHQHGTMNLIHFVDRRAVYV